MIKRATEKYSSEARSETKESRTNYWKLSLQVSDKAEFFGVWDGNFSGGISVPKQMTYFQNS